MQAAQPLAGLLHSSSPQRSAISDFQVKVSKLWQNTVQAAQPLAGLLHGSSPQLRAVAASTLAVVLDGRPAAAAAAAAGGAGAAAREMLHTGNKATDGKAGAELLLVRHRHPPVYSLSNC